MKTARCEAHRVSVPIRTRGTVFAPLVIKQTTFVCLFIPV
jgi:hypothetical protein